MDRQRAKPADPNRTVTPTAASAPTSAAVTMATLPSACTTCTLAPFTSLGVIPPDRQAVQVIQHAIHRPQSMAAQYLHQMYAAQQQHLMLQTAALQQASACPSSSGGLGQAAGVSQSSLTLPASPVTAQLIGRCQTSNSTAAATTISQQAMLLRNRPDNCNQAQMYLRTQMLILTPAATVAAVQTDLPAVTSCSSLPPSSQVQSLALGAHLPRALATAHSVVLKQPVQARGSSPAASFCALKTNHCADASAEAGPADAPPPASGPQLVPPALCPVQTHTVVKQQLTCPPAQRLTHHQLLLQQPAAAGPSGPRQLQPIALRVAAPEANASPLSLSVKRLTASSTNASASSASAAVPAASVQPQPPPLLAAPQRRTSLPQVRNQTPPPPLVLPRLPRTPLASPHSLSLHSVQALAVHSGRALLTEQELPVAEALIQMPYQNLPPPQTAAVDLKVHPRRRDAASPLGQTCKVNRQSLEDGGDGQSPQTDKSQTSLSAAPQQNEAVTGSSIASIPSVIRSAQVEEPCQLTTTSPPPPPPPPSLPAAARGPSQPEPAPPSVPGSPERIRTTHVLTHLIEGFVIREGLESFPVGPSSLLEDQQASLPQPQQQQTSGGAAAERSPPSADPSASSDSEVEDDGPAAAGFGGSAAAVLQCEFCGKRGFAHTFVRSKRFCSMTCVRRFSVSCTRRISMLRAGHRPAGRRGRPPSRVNGACRQQFLSQAHGSLLREEEEEDEEDEPRVPMTTRLRKQAEGKQDRATEQRSTDTFSVSDGCPSQWNVEQVFAYISSLPGGQEVADGFRSQEIDGQALLLLTEDHLVSTMNLKLGPALKLCAHINCLKDT
ncbi:polyhomeotic-like protein 3 isoform X2 [Betta splendens]|uniref:Polyhomeotic-like protein 3 isoform X2 n=1 Tax=Betta splendens TaxID=158456 RepID=A0A6P7KZX5_BETSP|nr:polyhomeotic-like protein 3 isoform X2 [Betta splendens]